MSEREDIALRQTVALVPVWSWSGEAGPSEEQVVRTKSPGAELTSNVARFEE